MWLKDFATLDLHIAELFKSDSQDLSTFKCMSISRTHTVNQSVSHIYILPPSAPFDGVQQPFTTPKIKGNRNYMESEENGANKEKKENR